MQRVMLKSKIHRATVSDCDLHYVGSITIDPDLLEAADIREHEQVHVVDVDNGARFETYTIAGERGSGDMKVNGAAARLVHRGDTIIVISYAQYDEAELSTYEPRVVHVSAGTNQIIDVDAEVATLLAQSAPTTADRSSVMSTMPTHVQIPADASRLPMTLPAADREEAARRADRHGHRLRPPERARGGDRRRRPRPDGRLWRDDRARLPVDRAGRARRAARARTRHAARAARRRSSSATCPSAPTRSATSRRSRPRCASSRRPAATPSSSRAAARRRSRAPARSSAPASR